ncbi:hypothetical protein [Sandaracinus amylolyticus]|uniref:Uncharacterized protein n=1 Tax=Sandaracinus amylolyticus TaxID=927083 RepID=A0A0F6YM48_9BACT|nr:hypothetical protein [Sandaracinus amylolyticus]AKF09885.1 hypothetical protein DB32_007034 [Sandaracinus amylolyticus]
MSSNRFSRWRTTVLAVLAVAAALVVASGIDHQRDIGPAKNRSRAWVVAREAKMEHAPSRLDRSP